MGDDTVVRAVGCGTITFHRESMIEDRGLGVSFLDGNVRVFPKTMGPSASYTIGVRCGKLYTLLFHP